jgi:hypothetical protein
VAKAKSPPAPRGRRIEISRSARLQVLAGKDNAFAKGAAMGALQHNSPLSATVAHDLDVLQVRCCPILHAKYDALYPIGSSDASDKQKHSSRNFVLVSDLDFINLSVCSIRPFLAIRSSSLLCILPCGHPFVHISACPAIRVGSLVSNLSVLQRLGVTEKTVVSWIADVAPVPEAWIDPGTSV